MLMIAIAIVAEGGAGPGLDPVPGPEEGGILGHAVEVAVGGPGLLPIAGPGPFLLVGLDLCLPDGPDRVP